MINKVIIEGYVADDPMVRATEGGRFARLRVATVERLTIRKSGVVTEHTEWHSISLWGKEAELADAEIRVGDAVYIEGAIRTSEWSDKSGKKFRTADIVAKTLRRLDTIEGYTLPRAIVERREQLYPSKSVSAPHSTTKPTYEVKAPAPDPDELPF
ncbi:MAG: single-stranded DNA-binding protein [Rikenellaceae bacterium]